MRTVLTYLLTILIIIVLSSWSFVSRKGSIHLTIEACKSDKGKVLIALYDNAKGYLNEEKAVIKKVVRIRNKKAILKLEGLPFGEYAVACYHDENSNLRLDKNIVGIPKEGFGFSNNVKPVFGAPSFSKCRFQLNKSEYYTAIKLLYF